MKTKHHGKTVSNNMDLCRDTSVLRGALRTAKPYKDSSPYNMCLCLVFRKQLLLEDNFGLDTVNIGTVVSEMSLLVTPPTLFLSLSLLGLVYVLPMSYRPVKSLFILFSSLTFTP